MTKKKLTFEERFMAIYGTLPPVELTPEQIAEIAAQIDLTDYVLKEPGKSLVYDTEIAKIHISGSDNQIIPDELSDLSDDATHRLVTDLEKSTWNGKEPGNINIQAHVTSVHAPSNAQANADITKAEIEAKLIGEVITHTHPGGGGGLTQQQIEGLI